MGDTGAVTGDDMSAEGTPFRRIRMPAEMWDRFGQAVDEGEPELDRSKVIREFIRWYVGDTRELPRRPGDAGRRATPR